jgi:tetrahydromethanopterin S-methyltransferase subunit B
MEDKLMQRLKELQDIYEDMNTHSLAVEKIDEILSKLETVVDDSEKTLNDLVKKINDNEETVHNTQG